MGNSAASTSRARRLAWVAAVLLPVLAVVVAATWLGRVSQAASSVPSEVASLESFQKGFTWVAEKMKPSVVFIEVEQKAKAGSAAQKDLRDLLPPDLFPFVPTPPRAPQTPGIEVGQGSGVIVDAAGYILTNDHVVDDASKITVHLVDGDSYDAQLIETDPLSDLAVIKIEPKRPLVAAELGDADRLQVGSWAIAVGYPFGNGKFDQPLHYEPTVTVGVISALHRQIPSERTGQPFRDLVQTDAPINPGNSGGPLVNIRAQVIGINQAIFTSGLSGGNIGLGFAIPINAHTRQIIDTVKSGKKVVRGRLGLLVAPLSETIRKVYGSDKGVYVANVEPGSPADKAGFKREDIIVSYQGKTMSSQDDFVNEVQNTKPGTTVSIEILRDGKPMTLRPIVEALKSAQAAATPEVEEPQKLGLSVESIPSDVAQKIGATGGVRVRAMEPVSDAVRARLQVGDIIVRINRQPVTDLASYKAIVNKLKPGDPVVFIVWRETDRKGSGEFVTLELPEVSTD